ncbi:caspase-3-like isoform X2 [Hydra vulgaris]
MGNLNNIKKRCNDTLNDTESLDVIDANPNKLKTTSTQSKERVSNTQEISEVLSRHKTYDFKKNYDDKIIFSHTQYFPNEPRIDLSKVDFKFNSDNFYNTNTFPRGTLTIINVKNFMKSSEMYKYPRDGTDVDADNLCDLFLKLGFKIDRFDNPKLTDVLEGLEKAANENYSSMSCCVVAVLTHGKEGELYSIDEALSIRKLTNIFCTEALANKPKFFLIQACRGGENMESLKKVNRRGFKKRQKKTNKANILEVPDEIDFLYAYSTVLGYNSWRNLKEGSYFIQDVVNAFKKNTHKMDVVRLLTRVNEELSEHSFEKDNKKQIGSISSHLRKDLFLPPINGPI